MSQETAAAFVKTLEAYFGARYTDLARQVIVNAFSERRVELLDSLISVVTENEDRLPLLARLKSHEKEAFGRAQGRLSQEITPARQLEYIEITEEDRQEMAQKLAGLLSDLVGKKRRIYG